MPLLESAIFVFDTTAGPNNQVTLTAIYHLAYISAIPPPYLAR